MKKKSRSMLTISLIITICTLVIPNEVTYAESSSINFDSANQYMLSHNRTIQKLELMKKKTKIQVEDAENGSKRAVSTLDTLKKYRIPIGISTNLQLTLARDIYPKQAVYGYDSISGKLLVTKNKLTLGLREIYMGVYNAYRDSMIASEKLELAKEKYLQEDLKYKQGKISLLELIDAKYNLEQAESTNNSAKRTFENLSRTLNSFTGRDIDMTYFVVYIDFGGIRELNNADYYINNALKNRFDVTDIEEKIKLDELQIRLYKRDNNLSSKNAIDTYKDIEKEYNTLLVNLEATKKDIKKEINQLYLGVMEAEKQIAFMDRMVDVQERKIQQLRNQLNQEMVSETMMREVEIGLSELKKQQEISYFQYDTKWLQLEFATDIGPGLN